MWVWTELGFVSIVTHLHRADDLLVRSRSHHQLHAVVKACGLEPTGPHAIPRRMGAVEWAAAAPGEIIDTTVGHDYEWRTALPREAVGSWLWGVATGLEYPNFKERCSTTLGAKTCMAMSAVWLAMQQVSKPASQWAGGLADELGPEGSVQKMQGLQRWLRARDTHRLLVLGWPWKRHGEEVYECRGLRVECRAVQVGGVKNTLPYQLSARGDGSSLMAALEAADAELAPEGVAT